VFVKMPGCPAGIETSLDDSALSKKTTHPRKNTPILLMALILILKLATERLPCLGLICSRTTKSLPRDLA